MFTTSFPSFMRQEFKKKLTALNKKLAKINDANQISITSETREYRSVMVATVKKNMDVMFDTVVLTDPIQLMFPGYQYVGSVNFEGGVKTIFAVDNTNLTDDSIVATRCDHCHTNRKRNRVHVFKFDDGSLKVIGNTCADQYVGISIDSALRTFFDFLKTNDDTDWGNVQHEAWGFNLDSLLNYIRCAHSLNSTYIKSSDMMNSTCNTVDMFNSMAFSTNPKVINEFKNYLNNASSDNQTVKDLLVKEFGNLDPTTSNFNSNLVNGIFYLNNDGTKSLRDFIPGKIRGIITWAVFSVLNKKPASNNVNTFIGNIGDKITVKGTVSLTKQTITRFGTSMLIILNTDQGEVKTFTSSNWAFNANKGDHLTICGQVAKHEEWKGKLSTQIKYPKSV